MSTEAGLAAMHALRAELEELKKKVYGEPNGQWDLGLDESPIIPAKPAPTRSIFDFSDEELDDKKADDDNSEEFAGLFTKSGNIIRTIKRQLFSYCQYDH